jgi:hypothetical protein
MESSSLTSILWDTEYRSVSAPRRDKHHQSECRLFNGLPNEINRKIVSFLPQDCLPKVPFDKGSSEYLLPVLDHLRIGHIKAQKLPILIVKYNNLFLESRNDPFVLKYTSKSDLHDTLQRIAPRALLNAFTILRNIKMGDTRQQVEDHIIRIVEAIPDSLVSLVRRWESDFILTRPIYEINNDGIRAVFAERLFGYFTVGREEVLRNWQYFSHTSPARQEYITELFNRHQTLVAERCKLVQQERERLYDTCGEVIPNPSK